MNETGRQELSGWSWRSTPPRPKDEASAVTLVSLFGSYRASTGACVRSDLICKWFLLLPSPCPLVSFLKKVSNGLCLVSEVLGKLA